jgi:hypothetical protein
MKTITAMTIVFLALLATTGISYSQDGGKPKGKAIVISIRLLSEVGGKSVAIAPKVVTLEKKTATITIGNEKTELNAKEVKTEQAQKDFSTRIEVTPSLVENVTPPLIKLEIKLSLSHNGYAIQQSFQTVVKEYESFDFESQDKTKGQKLAMKISASLAGSTPEKPHSSLDGERERSEYPIPLATTGDSSKE